MDVLVDILSKISEASVTVGTAAKALIAFIGGIFAARKLPKPPEGPKS